MSCKSYVDRVIGDQTIDTVHYALDDKERKHDIIFVENHIISIDNHLTRYSLGVHW
jgi:hypothetical protein